MVRVSTATLSAADYNANLNYCTSLIHKENVWLALRVSTPVVSPATTPTSTYSVCFPAALAALARTGVSRANQDAHYDDVTDDLAEGEVALPRESPIVRLRRYLSDKWIRKRL
jgi:hypothetical protein